MAARPGGRELAARINSYELAFRMQAEVPEAVDLGKRRKRRLIYTASGQSPTDEFGRNCVVARRLVERGVRFVQLYSGGGHLEETWDAHESVEKNHGRHAAEVDRPIAGLADGPRTARAARQHADLVGWRVRSHAFCRGRRRAGPESQSVRLHDVAGRRGVKGGISYGETDEFGFEAVTNKVHLHDIHATVLALMGLDHERLDLFPSGARRAADRCLRPCHSRRHRVSPARAEVDSNGNLARRVFERSAAALRRRAVASCGRRKLCPARRPSQTAAELVAGKDPRLIVQRRKPIELETPLELLAEHRDDSEIIVVRPQQSDNCAGIERSAVRRRHQRLAIEVIGADRPPAVDQRRDLLCWTKSSTSWCCNARATGEPLLEVAAGQGVAVASGRDGQRVAFAGVPLAELFERLVSSQSDPRARFLTAKGATRRSRRATRILNISIPFDDAWPDRSWPCR